MAKKKKELSAREALAEERPWLAIYGANIRRLRKAAELSQEQVAEALGEKQAQYSLRESGKVNIDLRQAQIIAKRIGCKVDDFFEGVE